MVNTSLKELLEEKSELYEAEFGKNRKDIDEWVESVRRLFDQLRTWLKSSDPKQILEISEKTIQINEPYFGRYDVPRLDIRAFGIWMGIIPKARMDIRNARPPQFDAPEWAAGRVDMTNEIRRYVLYRSPAPDGYVWSIQGPLADQPRPLSRALFEEAVADYFR